MKLEGIVQQRLVAGGIHGLGLALLSCAFLASPPPAGAAELLPLSGSAAQPPAPWHFAGLPGQTKPQTQFSVSDLEGRKVLKVEAEASYGNLVHPLPAATPAGRLAWQWRVDRFSPGADLRSRSGDDAALKVCASFDMPVANLSFLERQVFHLANMHASEPLPSATLCYVWDEHLAPGTLLDNAYTRRIRFIVLRNAGDGLAHWQSEQRDLAEDFHRAFGDESAEVPPLAGVAIGADADNTHGHSLAYVAGLDLEP